MCELRAPEAVPLLSVGSMSAMGTRRSRKRGCLVPLPGIFALPRPCQCLKTALRFTVASLLNAHVHKVY